MNLADTSSVGGNNKIFHPIFVEATTLDDCWFRLLWHLFDKGKRYHIDDGSYAGRERLTFDHISGFVHFPHTRPLAPYVPEGTVPPPTTEHDIEQYFANYLMNSELEKNEDYRYSTFIVGGEYELPPKKMSVGMRIPKYAFTEGTRFSKEVYNIYPDVINVPNQVDWVINHFKQKGFGNEHCYITVGYPESSFAYDIPYINENERKTSPCLRGLNFRVVEGHLILHIIYRSWDLVSGWPTNMGGFTLLNEFVASELNIIPGPVSFSCSSLHAYDHAYDYLKIRLGK